jgi:serine/threonine protein kinase
VAGQRAQQQPILLQNGRYVLNRFLGRGSFGEVWAGRDVVQDSAVAVKLVDLGVHLDPALVQQAAAGALLETRVLTRLRAGDRVVTIRNVAIEPPMAFIVMDYLQNGSVEGRLNAGATSLVEAVRWTREALDGLAYAHGLGVIHRDIKPGNLLLDDEDRAVLSDFGIAEDTLHNLLAINQVYVMHAAPELLQGQPSSHQTDIWAMGCTLYRLVTGQFPFADTATVLNQAPTDPHRLNPQIPMPLTRVIRKMLDKDPADRYSNARDVIDDLIDCHITHAWGRVPDPETIETWTCSTGQAHYELTVRQRPSGSFEVRVRRDLGAGFRHVHRGPHATIGRALQARRGLLVQLVEGQPIS